MLDIDMRFKQGILFIRLNGILNGDTCMKLEESISTLIEDNGIKYVYKLAGKYEVEKTGEVVIHRDNTKSTLTLITCSKDDDTKQVVYMIKEKRTLMF